jgi:hypothetical protein
MILSRSQVMMDIEAPKYFGSRGPKFKSVKSVLQAVRFTGFFVVFFSSSKQQPMY